MTGRRAADLEPVEVVWEAPPPPRETLGIYEEALAEVKRNPGRWARLRSLKQSSAYGARKRLVKLLAEEEAWELTTARLDSNGTYGLYAHYRTPEQMAATTGRKGRRGA